MVDEIAVPSVRPRSTFIEKALAISAIIVAIAVPIATSYIASKYAKQSSSRQGEVQMVGLAVSILQTDPTPSSEGIRRWALDVLDLYSGVKIPAQARQTLVTSEALPGRPASSPDLVGRTFKSAQSIALSLGLKLVTKNCQPDSMVVRQSPATGTVVPTGTVVDLLCR